MTRSASQQYFPTGLRPSPIEALPRDFRLVSVMHEAEGMMVVDIAQALGLVPAAVKTCLLRARRRLREALAPELQASLVGAFPFTGEHCAVITEKVLTAVCSGMPSARS